MDIGMVIHRLAPPWAPSPAFTKEIPVTVSPIKGKLRLYFYVPESYKTREKEKIYPVVVNFHGGGFTLGRGTDDARWAGAVTEQSEAVVVSVDYRLAPEYPFPTAVEDGADAVLWIAAHSKELGLDRDRMALSGFSAGGNLCFTVPLKLHDYFSGKENLQDEAVDGSTPKIPSIQTILSFYPTTDYTNPRLIRHQANTENPNAELPGYLTNLFDESYLYDMQGVVDPSNPYLSPGVATEEMLAILPESISIWACEWDGLRAEARRLADRLEARGKNSPRIAGIADSENTGDAALDVTGEGLTEVKVKFRIVEKARHAWDKMPNPIAVHATVEKAYREACGDLKCAFGEKQS